MTSCFRRLLKNAHLSLIILLEYHMTDLFLGMCNYAYYCNKDNKKYNKLFVYLSLNCNYKFSLQVT